MITPSIWTDEDFTAVPRDCRLLYIGIISNADDEGRMKGSPRALRLTIFPADKVTDASVKTWRDTLARRRLVRLYVVDGQEYVDLPGWKKYQTIQRPVASLFPSFTKELEYKVDIDTVRVPYPSDISTAQISRSEVKGSKEKTTFGRTDPALPGDEALVFWGNPFTLTDALLTEWSAAYPAVDVRITVKRAAAWAAANPRKKKAQIARFLVNWLAREQEHGGTRGSVRTAPGNGMGELPKRESPYVIPQIPTADPLPELTDEQRAANIRRVREMTAQIGKGVS